MTLLILQFHIVLPKRLANVKEQQNISIDTVSKQETDLINFFYRPIDFNADGLSYYFKHVYNHPEYTQYLPYNLSHMIQFLDYGRQTEQTEAFAASVIKLFMQKVKATPYIDAESFVEFLPKFADAMKPYLEKKDAAFLGEVQAVLKDRLTNVFSKYFSYFQRNPDGFMNSLSEQLAKQTNQLCTTQHVEIAELKKDVLRFIELCANKLVWSSKDDLQVWYVCNKLAYEVQQCLEKGVISGPESFDDGCWSLIHRFCYFLELSAPTLSPEFYDQVLSDLKTKPLILTAADEQEDNITSKRAHLISRVQMYKNIAHPKPLENFQLHFNDNKIQAAID
tara:strand:- start:5428 stop:6435 length:1008 start_codon:yes stop_codon:yes gene_type:complete